MFAASIQDGRGQTVHRRLFIVQAEHDGSLLLRQPTLLLDVSPAPEGTVVPDGSGLPDRHAVEHALVETALRPFLAEVDRERSRELDTVSRHLEISLAELINRQNLQLAELVGRREAGVNVPGLEGNIKQAEDHLDELNNRLETRRTEMAMERQLAIGEIAHVGRAWVLPHPDRTSPGIAPMVRDEEVERLAVAEATCYEEARGWVVESVEQDNRGFDLISRKPHPHDVKTFTDVRFIEVKGRAGVGEIALTANEYKTAERLKHDYWLYVVFNCGTKPALHAIRDPVRLGWKVVVQVAHYHVEPGVILADGQEPR